MHIKMSDEFHGKLKNEAYRRDMSMAGVLRMAFYRLIEDNEKQAQKTKSYQYNQ